MTNELERLVALKGNKAIDKLAVEIGREESSKMADLTNRGMLRSGGTVTVIMNLSVKQMEGFSRARYDAFKDVYGAAGLLTPETIRSRGKKEAEHIRADLIMRAVESHQYARGLLEGEVLTRMISEAVDRSRSDFLRDVEIDALNMEAVPKVKTASATLGSEYDVFISFAMPDRSVAECADGLLKDQGLKVFFSPKELEGGDPWEERIRAALVGAKELCVFVSKASLAREWVLTEWGAAWATQKRMTPVLVDCEISDLPHRLQSKQCISISNLEGTLFRPRSAA